MLQINIKILEKRKEYLQLKKIFTDFSNTNLMFFTDYLFRITRDEKDIFASGTLILHGEKKPLLPAKLIEITPTQCTLEIVEGKYHQVKRMFEKANCTVTYLQRIEFSPLKLNDLPLGEFRALTQEELDALKG